MSHFIYGCISTSRVADDLSALQQKLEYQYGVGIRFCWVTDKEVRDPRFQLHHFPTSVIPESAHLRFVITDSPENDDTASYLIDGLDYAEEASLTLPYASRDRLILLSDVVSSLFQMCETEALAVLVTESCECDAIVQQSIGQWKDQLLSDFESSAPSCKLYVLTR